MDRIFRARARMGQAEAVPPGRKKTPRGAGFYGKALEVNLKKEPRVSGRTFLMLKRQLLTEDRLACSQDL